jgi:hypothetical protein
MPGWHCDRPRLTAHRREADSASFHCETTRLVRPPARLAGSNVVVALCARQLPVRGTRRGRAVRSTWARGSATIARQREESSWAGLAAIARTDAASE